VNNLPGVCDRVGDGYAAARHLRHERPHHTLQPTALVNEVYIKLVAQRNDWQSRAHFFAVASNLMRRILVDYARRNLRFLRCLACSWRFLRLRFSIRAFLLRDQQERFLAPCQAGDSQEI
jgi:ECF sigma factor